MRTAQYFKDDIETQLSYEPDFYVQNTSDNLRYPNEKTIIYSSTIDKASECLNKGFADVMIDGYLLIDLK
jgi:predicted kinase